MLEHKESGTEHHEGSKDEVALLNNQVGGGEGSRTSSKEWKDLFVTELLLQKERGTFLHIQF
jgi:hypothetical protein